jgi:glycosyltransferase involved in cell wall biosynthesis
MTASARRHKVVRIIARLNVGGPAQQVCFLHENLGPDFETVLIAGRLDPGEADMSHLLTCVDRVYWVDRLSRAIMPWSDAAALWKIYRVLRRETPDIVHTHTAKAGTLGRIAALLAGVPCRIHTYHGTVFRGYFGPLATRFFLAIERTLARGTSKIIVVSESQRNELVDHFKVAGPDQVLVLRNGFDLHQLVHNAPVPNAVRHKYSIPKEKVVVTWAGRMVPIKGINLLCDVIDAAVSQQNVHFLVVGDGPQADVIKRRMKGRSNVTLTGWIKDMSEVWADTDMALLTSLNEGTPTALIEAMAFGKPFVATDVGGVRDLTTGPSQKFEHGIETGNGFLTSTDPRALLECIRLLASDRKRAEAMGNSGRELVFRNYCCDRLAGDMRKLYHDLVAPASAQAGNKFAVHSEA